MHVRGSGEAARRAKRGRCLSRPAPLVTRVAICVSRVLLDRLQKNGRLLEVYEFADHFDLCARQNYTPRFREELRPIRFQSTLKASISTYLVSKPIFIQKLVERIC